MEGTGQWKKCRNTQFFNRIVHRCIDFQYIDLVSKEAFTFGHNLSLILSYNLIIKKVHIPSVTKTFNNLVTF